VSHQPSLRTAESCLRRAVKTKETADALWESGDEWAAVCYFYAAYHAMKAALIEDPVFDSLTDLAKHSPFLLLEDRFATKHNGYFGAGVRRMGVNDIVVSLYPTVAAEYVRLHIASVGVRYGNGLAPITLQSVRNDYDAVIGAYQSGELKA
jgi:hypothetical protein